MLDITVNLYCVVMRNGIEIWLEKEKIQKLQDVLSAIKQSTFIHLDNRTINSADIVGIFPPNDMADQTRRKNGQWKCNNCGSWHDKFEKCSEDSVINKILNK